MPTTHEKFELAFFGAAIAVLKNISIHQRLLSGYALILGLAVAGTTAGLIIGNRYQRQALNFQQAATMERSLLKEIKIGILYNRPTKQLSPYLNDPVRFDQESQQFLENVDYAQSLIKPHESIHSQIHGHDLGRHSSHLESEINDLHPLLSQGAEKAQNFYDRTQAFIAVIDELGYASETLEQAQDEVISLAQSDEFRDFGEFANQLTPFIDQAKQRELEAIQSLDQAEKLRFSIVMGSLFASVAIASLVGFYTSQAIAHPIKAVTTVAQQVTQNSNFDLQAPVEGQGEVSSLATSLNQLIQQVKHLLSEVHQKNAELEHALEKVQRQQSHLVQSEKMSSLGQLVSGIAHEINNPVNFIHGNLHHLQEYTDDLLYLIGLFQDHYPEPNEDLQAAIDECELEFVQDDLPKTLSSMSVGTRRIREIVLSLRNFARLDEAELKPADLHEGLNNTLLLLQHRIKPSPKHPEIKIIREYGDVPPIECYAGPLNQVFMNILANAIDALEEQTNQSEGRFSAVDCPTIRINTSLVRGEQGDGLWAQIAIADNGPGMDEETQKRMFDPFFTTKPTGKGTGLGMAICYQLVTDRHDGQLDCNSTPGKGTEFVIKLPIRPSTMPTDTEVLNSELSLQSRPEEKAIA